MPAMHFKRLYLLAILLVADQCAQELLKIKTVSEHLFNLSIINVFVKVVTKLYECFY